MTKRGGACNTRALLTKTKGMVSPMATSSISLEDRFWSKVNKTSGCWVWTAHRHRGGHGQFCVRHSLGLVYAHRFSYEMHHGPIPEGLIVCHRCDNPACVRAECNVPGCLHLRLSEECRSHLYVGTDAENAADRDSKGRCRGEKKARHGESSGNAKLTNEQVAEIRARYVPRVVSVSRLAKEYGVGRSAIHRIISGQSWGHLLSHERRQDG